MGEGPRTEEIKGRVKEAAGTLTGQEDMENEAQRKKASAQEEARQKEAEAIEAEQHQRANQ